MIRGGGATPLPYKKPSAAFLALSYGGRGYASTEGCTDTIPAAAARLSVRMMRE